MANLIFQGKSFSALIDQAPAQNESSRFGKKVLAHTFGKFELSIKIRDGEMETVSVRCKENACKIIDCRHKQVKARTSRAHKIAFSIGHEKFQIRLIPVDHSKLLRLLLTLRVPIFNSQAASRPSASASTASTARISPMASSSGMSVRENRRSASYSSNISAYRNIVSDLEPVYMEPSHGIIAGWCDATTCDNRPQEFSQQILVLSFLNVDEVWTHVTGCSGAVCRVVQYPDTVVMRVFWNLDELYQLDLREFRVLCQGNKIYIKGSSCIQLKLSEESVLKISMQLRLVNIECNWRH